MKLRGVVFMAFPLVAVCLAGPASAGLPEGGSARQAPPGRRPPGGAAGAAQGVAQSPEGQKPGSGAPPAPAVQPSVSGKLTSGIDYATVRFSRVVHALRVQDPILLDGKLDEAVWDRAESAGHFTQWEPRPGMPATDDTDVRFLYDAANLYVGVRCLDSEPTRLTANELRKDFEPGRDDGIGIVLDTLHDRQSGFMFETNPVGARRDAQVSQDGEQTNVDWDGVWDVKTHVDEKGWTAEMVIPFKTLRFSGAENQEWGLNVIRRVQRTNEDSHWVPLERRYRLSRVSMAGTLAGITAVSGGRNFKLKPYVMFNATQPEDKPRAFQRDGGFDLKYGLTKATTLDVTYRTDFSQVEVDQQQVNLTRFSVFFPEKREFFLENTGVFAIGAGRGWSGSNVIPFFSRRIGLGQDADGNSVPVPLTGGARATGKIGTYDVGLLAMRTGEDGDNPANKFFVGRVRKNFSSNSTVGAIFTSRDSTIPGDDNRLFGVDTFQRFFQKLEVNAYLLATGTPQSSEKLAGCADTGSLKGCNLARQLGVAWRDNDWNLSADYDQVQPNFNPEVGFVRRGNMTHISTDGNWRPRPRRSGRIRNYTFGLNTDQYLDANGVIETRTQWASAGIVFQDSAQVQFTFNNAFERLDSTFAIYDVDDNTRDVVLPVGDYQYHRYQFEYSSDRSRVISGNLNVGTGQFWDGTNRTVRGGIQYKPNYHFNIEFSLNANDVRLREGRFRTNLVGVRLLYAFTSRAFFNTFLQYNSKTDEFSMNSRFNIIHRPLSDFFLVYNERRNTLTGALIDRGLAVKFTNMFDF